MAHNKRCSCCKRLKAASDFYRKTASKDGLQSYCKECDKAYCREHTEHTPRIRHEDGSRELFLDFSERRMIRRTVVTYYDDGTKEIKEYKYK